MPESFWMYLLWFGLWGMLCFCIGFIVNAAFVERERRQKADEAMRWRNKFYPSKPVPRG